jgi:hypothetical protein
MPYTGGYPEGSGTKWMRGRYDFAVDGGAISSITISAENIPANAIILGGVVEVDTAVTSVVPQPSRCRSSPQATSSQRRPCRVLPWSTTGRKSVIPAFTGATTVKTTAARGIVVVIAAATLTAGQVDVLLAYTSMGD